MLPDAVRRLVGDWSLKPGERAVVVTVDDAGLEAAAVLRERRRRDRRGRSTCDASACREIAAQGRSGMLRSVELDGRKVSCDLLVMSGGRAARLLAARAGRRPDRVRRRPRHLRPDRAARRGRGRRRGDRRRARVQRFPPPRTTAPQEGQVLRLHLRGRDRQGREAGDRRGLRLDRARQALHDGDDGPVPGPALPRSRRSGSTRARTSTDEATIGTTTARPPWAPVSLGLLAGRPHEPAQRTSIHHRHKELGATDDVDGHLAAAALLRRPGGARRKSVHDAVGVIDVSTLGKLLVSRPGRGRVPRAPLPEPLRRHEGRSDPLRRARTGRGRGSWTTARSPASTRRRST